MLRFHLCLQQGDKIPRDQILHFYFDPLRGDLQPWGGPKYPPRPKFQWLIFKKVYRNGYPICLIGGWTNRFEKYQSNQNCIIYMQLGVKVQEIFETTT